VLSKMKNKEEIRKKINVDTAAYLKKGGTITEIPLGETADPYTLSIAPNKFRISYFSYSSDPKWLTAPKVKK